MERGKLNYPAYKTEGVNRTKTMRFHPFVSTGKERDEETGYGYFGVRYMDHELMTMWLSVDPLADKYPSISPYAYCAWNPVKLVDPDGRKIRGVKYNAETGQFKYSRRARRNGVDKYISARCKTASGRASIIRMIESKKKFGIHVTNRPLVIPSLDEDGKVCQLRGIVLNNDNILISTADKTRTKCGAILVDGENVLEWYHLVRKNEWATNTADQNFKDAYEATEMGDFDQSHPYQSEEQKIHGIGAHEESHALDNASEEQALETEKRERLEYIKENPNVQ